MPLRATKRLTYSTETVPKIAGHDTVVLRASLQASLVLEIGGARGRSEKVCARAVLSSKLMVARPDGLDKNIVG